MLLHVKVAKATHVPTTDLISKSDPFVVLIPSFSKTRVQTRWIKDNDCPDFDEDFTFVVKNEEEDYIIFQIFDHDELGSHDLLADLKVYVRDFIEGEVKTKIYEMEPAAGINQTPNLVLQIQLAVRGRPKFVPYKIIQSNNQITTP
ncbi:Protein Aster-C [Tritrichomonas musculus]|uniref:Protein Aster-C n=1 Tax=Tritrichomonas musculus TaxID=1915356 RepID=A0ABR2GN26_9EUKA